MATINKYKVYAGQSLLKINVDTKIDLTGSSVKIKWAKPDGTTGEAPATITDAVNGLVEYQPPQPNTVQDDNGVYTFWAFVTAGNGRTAPGEPFKVKFNIEGN